MAECVCDLEYQDCMIGTCKECPGVEKLKNFLCSCDELLDVKECKYQQWISVDRTQLITIIDSKEEFIDRLLRKICDLTRHSYIAKAQTAYMNSLKSCIEPEKEIILQGDFAENFHWENAQTTLHPFVASKVLASVEMQRKFMLEAQTVILKCTDSTITEEELIKLGSSINASYYDDVAVERSLQKMCGYPICSSTLKQMPKQKYHISTKANKVYDITERKDFCSNQCYKRSKYFKDQLPTCPVWLIDKSEYSSFSLLKDESTRGLPGQEYGMDFPSNECNSGFKTPKSNVSVCDGDNLNDDLEDYETEISLDNEEILENELEQLPKEADSLKSLNEKGNKISESLEKLLDFCDAEAIDITTPSDDRGKNNITNHTKIKQSFGQNKSSPEKKRIHQKLVDAVPEARTAPTRKIQLIDFQPMPKVLAKGLNIDYSKSVKFSDKKYETETFKTVSDENIHINDEISNKAVNPPVKNRHFETVQTILSQWMTSNSCKFLIGEKMFEEHLAAGKTVLKTKQLDLTSLELSYINMLQRLDLEEKEEEELDTTLIGKSVPDNSQESQTLPDIDKFKEDTERMTMNMRSFFLGKPEYISNLEADNENIKPPNQSQNTGKGKDFKKSSSRKKSKNTVKSKDVKSISEKSDESITNKKDDDGQPILPLVDHCSQITLRRQMVMRHLTVMFHDVVPILELNLSQAPYFKELISTFNFTADNISLKPKEWRIMAYLLLNLISVKVAEVAKKLDEQRQNLISYLVDDNISEEEIDKYINVRTAFDRKEKGESAALMEEVMKCLESLESLWGDFESGLGVTARLWSMYIDMMLILRRYIHAERAGLWQQHLQEVRNMLPYTIASGHSKYMSCLPIYLNEMQKLPETAPEVHEEFAAGKFTVHQTAGDFNGVWTDLAMAFIQRFNTLGSSTFGQLQERYRDKLLNMKPRHCTEVHFVGDQYDFELKSLKSDERQRQESNINLPERHPGLAGFCLVLGVNAQATRVTQTEHTDVDELYCPNHEEADTRIFAHIASCDDNNVFVIQATDTDIIFLAMYHFPRLPNVVELWVEKNDLFLSIHDLVNELAKAVGKDGLALTDTLLISYILSGCDSVSYPFKRGKKRTVKVALEHVDKHPTLSNCIRHESGPSAHDQVITEARSFFCDLYGKPGYLSLDKLRAHLFASSKLDLRSLPPTEDAFHFHVLRSLCQICLYKQASLSNPVLLPPEEYGRIVDGDRLIPVMKSKPSKPSAAKLKYCKCKKKPNCLRNCPCAKVNWFPVVILPHVDITTDCGNIKDYTPEGETDNDSGEEETEETSA
ncbi:putative RNA polymerase II subunit B1 CTD phosphatase rpap2 [Nymphon striatum]|nr:putative RNA polymerase II subunit B1 CTD phosphatase rpap2 [Nymphon striatum]KAG1680228.1 putative RNA polymerase II subunit B1 CTD phosphatase rpap2 [Nymphon striatum]KAG1680230.1 putative RNA polymerase II subunit B1 CTD phosphatase rpap2 [Nymphon striatum]